MRRAVMPVSGVCICFERKDSKRAKTMNQSAPAVLHTPGFAHSNVAWSPFHITRIAIASSANYGIIGNGRLHIASTLSSPSGTAGIKLDKLSVS